VSEISGVVLKILSALISFKACIKYISVGVILLIAWVYVEPELAKLNISNEHKSFVLLMVSVGVGALIGQVISTLFEILNSKWKAKREIHKSKKQKTIDDQASAQKQTNLDDFMLRKFEAAFPHMPVSQRSLLRELTVTDKGVDILNKDYSAMLKHEYIQSLVHLTKSEHLVQINPLIKDKVTIEWNQSLNERIIEFFNGLTSDSEHLLEILKYGNSEIKVKKSIVSSLSKYSGAIRGEADEGGYWVWFDDYILEKFQEKTGHQYIDEIFVDKSRLCA